MGIYLHCEETEDLMCDCGFGWDDYDLYSCDVCGKTLCPDCKAITDDDCPNEFCVDCI